MIDVVGVGAQGWEAVPADLKALVLGADVVLGGHRHLAMLPASPVRQDAEPAQERIPWPSPLRPQLAALIEQVGERRCAVLASGDPLRSGVGSTLIGVLGPGRVRVHPALSSATLARARMGWAAEEVVTVSVVGRELDRIRRDLAPGVRMVVLSGGPVPPADVAELLREEGYGPSRMTVLADLGADTEQRWDGRADDVTTWSGLEVPPLHLVAVECRPSPSCRPRSLVPGLPDDAFQHDGQLTKRTARASALSHLEPLPGQLLWDVGAGAGSIAIEWCRVHPRNRAVAVERRPDRADRIRANASSLGVPSQLQVVTADAASAVTQLEAPDAVFIGGGSDADLLERCWQALRPGGRIVVHCVTVETEQVVLAARTRLGGTVTRVSVEHLEPIGSYHGWRPARAVTQWSAVRPMTDEPPGPADARDEGNTS